MRRPRIRGTIETVKSLSSHGLKSATRMLLRGSRQGLDLLAPERCLFCDQRSDQDLSICRYCEDALVRNDEACPSCALPACRGQLCPECLTGGSERPTVLAPYVYDPMLAYFLHCWKYNGDWRLAQTAAKLMLKVANFRLNEDILLSTPLFFRRLLKRGFNQSEDLLQALHQQAPDQFPRRPCAVRLQRTASGQSQAHATRRERRQQVRGAFRVCGRLDGQPVTLIDDVCTTGATAAELTRALKAAGAGPVTLLCLARTPAHGPSS